MPSPRTSRRRRNLEQWRVDRDRGAERRPSARPSTRAGRRRNGQCSLACSVLAGVTVAVEAFDESRDLEQRIRPFAKRRHVPGDGEKDRPAVGGLSEQLGAKRAVFESQELDAREASSADVNAGDHPPPARRRGGGEPHGPPPPTCPPPPRVIGKTWC